MKNIFLKVCAALLAGCIVLSSITAVQIGKVYAEENQDVEDNYEENYEEDVTPEVILQSEPEPAPEPPAYEPDPFDYNLICYTPSISFGTVYAGDTVPAKQFSIVNVGQTSFPLTWEEVDPNTAFDIGYISPDLNMDPGRSRRRCSHRLSFR